MRTDKNIRIAKQLVKLAKSLVTAGPYDLPGPGDFKTPWEDDEGSPWENSGTDPFNMQNEPFRDFIGEMKKLGFEYVTQSNNMPEYDYNSGWTLETDATFKRNQNSPVSISDDEFFDLPCPNIKKPKSFTISYEVEDPAESFEVTNTDIDDAGNYIVTLCSTCPGRR